MPPAVEPVETPLWKKPFFLILVAGLTILLFVFLPRHKESQPALPQLSRNELVLRDNRLYRTNDNSLFTGYMTEFYPEGPLKARTVVSNGVVDGLSEGWHTNGVLEVREHFTNGVSHGLREKWYASGKKLSEANIVAGKLNGPFRRWHENGRVAEEIEMKEGLPDGIAHSYFPSGFMQTEARLDHGKVVETKSWQDGEHK